MSDTPCPFCGQIHGTACDATTPANPTDQIATVAATYEWRRVGLCGDCASWNTPMCPRNGEAYEFDFCSRFEPKEADSE